jgi:hypothetical protein
MIINSDRDVILLYRYGFKAIAVHDGSAPQIKCYIITDRIYNSKRRFPTIRTTNLIQAMGINLWNGSIWVEFDNGKRKLLKRVIN